MSGRTNPVITRCYWEPSEVEPYAQGLRLVLDLAEKIRKGGCATARAAAKES
jgi:hypothetical protein